MSVENEHDGSDEYVLSATDRGVLAAAKGLLFKVLGSGLPSEEQRSVVSRIGDALAWLPAPFEPFTASVTLIGPRRWFGPNEIFHWWTVEIEGDVVTVKSGGHFYRKSTGGDSFKAMHWMVAPGCASEHQDFLHSLEIVDDAAPFAVEVQAITIEEDDYSLEVLDDGDEVAGESADESNDFESEYELLAEELPDRPLTPAESWLRGFEDLARARRVNERHCSPPDDCDLCHEQLADARYFVDGNIPTRGEWANMCPACARRVTARIAYGAGQLYARQSNGEWLLVGGFSPESH